MNNSIKYQPNIKIFIKVFFITVLTSFLLTHNKCFGFSLFEGNKLDKGQWTVVNDTMIKARYNATANLLPDGNVLIMGGEGLIKYPNVAEIFDPKQQKIIKRILIRRHFMYDKVSATSLKNGYIYISYSYNDLEVKKYIAASMIFDSKTYTFKDISNSFEGKVASTTDDMHILLKNGHLLIVPRYSENRYITVYNPNQNKYYKVIGNNKDNYLARKYFQLENGDIIFFFGGGYIDVISIEWQKTNLKSIRNFHQIL